MIIELFLLEKDLTTLKPQVNLIETTFVRETKKILISNYEK